MSTTLPTTQEKVMKTDDFIISKTDKSGKITYCNEIFMDMAMRTEAELLGAPHNIIRHPDMPKVVFTLLWEKVNAGDEIFAYVKNLSKDGSFYWVFANITPSYDAQNNIIGFYSVRIKPNPKALETITPLYQRLRDLESSSDSKASQTHLNNILKEKGVSYDEFVITLQADK
jgi:PAS domain S-box-containing protein